MTIGRPIQLPSILLAVLCISPALTASDSTQVIPFDYFYGRIVGRQQVGLDYRDSEGQRARIDGSLYFGFRGHFSFWSDRIFSWVPNLDNDALTYHELPLLVEAQLSDALRIRQGAFSLQSSHRVDATANSLYLAEQDGISVEQSLIYWPSASSHVRASHSLFYYLDGLWLEPNKSLIEAGWSFSRTSLSREHYFEQLLEPSQSFTRRGDDNFDWGAHASLRRGLSSKVQLMITGRLSQESNTVDGETQSIRDVGDNQIVEGFREWSNARDIFEYDLDGRLDYLVASVYWISARFKSIYRYEVDESSGRENDLDGLRDSRHLGSTWENDIEFGLKSSWISTKSPIPTKQILDNFQKYYGNQLPINTFYVSVEADMFYREDNSRFASYQDQQLQYWFPTKRIWRGLNLSFHPLYYFRPNLSAGLEFTVHRSLQEGSHNVGGGTRWHYQRNTTTFQLDLRSYVWSASSRESVSWRGINDIDYLLGALQQPGDLKLSFRLQPPRYIQELRNKNVGLFNFFVGDNDKTWEASLEGQIGVRRGIEVGLGVLYTDFRYRFTSSQRYTSYFWSTYVRCQPTQYARASLELFEVLSDRSYFLSGFPRDRNRNGRTWSLNIGIDIVI